MKGSNERPHARTPGALWLGAPLVLAACVAAEAAPAHCGALDREPVQVSLSRRVRDGVALLARNARPSFGQAQVTAILLSLDRLTGNLPFSAPWPVDVVSCIPAAGQTLSVFLLDPGHTSAPTSAP